MFSRLSKFFKRNKRQPHPYERLNMGMVNAYSVIIPKTELPFWVDTGWVEVPDFHNYHYAPGPTETVVLSRPSQLSEVDPHSLIGRTILAYDAYCGTYGMGGPGFLGFTFSDIAPPDNHSQMDNQDVLVYAVWQAGGYTLIDGRVVTCHPRYHGEFYPWISDFWEDGREGWDDLTPVVSGCQIDSIQLHDDACVLAVSGAGGSHVIEFRLYRL